MNAERFDRACGALLGGAVGDALGMPASFFTRKQIKEHYGFIRDFLPPAEAQQAHGALEAGDITDDTQETVLLARSLCSKGRFDRADFLQRMARWAEDSAILSTTVIGPSTRRFLEAVTQGRDPEPGARESRTNGSAMRVAPVGIRFWQDAALCAREAAESSRPSHASAPCMAGACAVACAVAAGVRGGYSPGEILDAAYEGALYGESAGCDIPAPSVAGRILLARKTVDRQREKGLDACIDELCALIGAGMEVYESVPFALGIFYAAEGDVQNSLLAAVNAGDDADTNAAIAGAVAGAYRGASALPSHWRQRIRQQEELIRYARELLSGPNP